MIHAIALAGLLLLRNLFAPLAAWIWGAAPPLYEQIPAWYEHGTQVLTYLLIGCAICIPRTSLSEWFADRAFVWLVIIAAGLEFAFYLPAGFDVFTALVGIWVLWSLKTGRLRFGPPSPAYVRSLGPGLLFLAPALLLCALAWRNGSLHGYGVPDLGATLLAANLPGVLAEEVMYRGLPWLFLRRFGVPVAFALQAVAFWLSHLNDLGQPAVFWFWVPWGAIWLGLIVTRSKSLAAGTVAHFVFNVASILIKW
jgi:membrane protease YdiL (CAAX protease family)